MQIMADPKRSAEEREKARVHHAHADAYEKHELKAVFSECVSNSNF